MSRYVKLKEPTEHTPEPWTPENYGMTFDSELDLERACACVNFCRGIPTETLLRRDADQKPYFEWLGTTAVCVIIPINEFEPEGTELQ